MAVSIIDPRSELQQTPGKGSIHHEDPKETVLNSRSTRSRVSTNYSWEGLLLKHSLELVARVSGSVQKNYSWNYSNAWGNWRASTPSSSRTKRSPFPFGASLVLHP